MMGLGGISGLGRFMGGMLRMRILGRGGLRWGSLGGGSLGGRLVKVWVGLVVGEGDGAYFYFILLRSREILIGNVIGNTSRARSHY